MPAAQLAQRHPEPSRHRLTLIEMVPATPMWQTRGLPKRLSRRISGGDGSRSSFSVSLVVGATWRLPDANADGPAQRGATTCTPAAGGQLQEVLESRRQGMDGCAISGAVERIHRSVTCGCGGRPGGPRSMIRFHDHLA